MYGCGSVGFDLLFYVPPIVCGVSVGYISPDQPPPPPPRNAFLSLMVDFVLANSYAAFHLGLYCTCKYPFMCFWSTKGSGTSHRKTSTITILLLSIFPCCIMIAIVIWLPVWRRYYKDGRVLKLRYLKIMTTPLIWSIGLINLLVLK